MDELQRALVAYTRELTDIADVGTLSTLVCSACKCVFFPPSGQSRSGDDTAHALLETGCVVLGGH